MKMPHNRMLSTMIPMIALFAGGLAVGAVNADEPKPCAAKKFETKEVEAACKKGGQKGAKDMMKAVVKKAKAAGESMKCETCHKDLKAYDLKPDAQADLKKWL
jgi:hypothetical protein